MIQNATTFKQASKVNNSYAFRALYEKPIVKVSTALMLTLFAIIFFGIFAIRPTLSTIAELVKKIDEQKVIVEKLNKKSAALATAQSEYLLVENKLGLVEAAIPPTHSTEQLLKQIEGAAAELQLPLSSLQVDTLLLPPDPQDERMIDGVIQIPLVVGVEAPYSSLSALVDLITQLKRFLTVESISFTVVDTADQATSTIRMTLQIYAYYLPVTDLSAKTL